MAEARILVAAASVTFTWEGQEVYIREGVTTAREGHPILDGREHQFRPLAVDFELPAPGPEAPQEAPEGPAPRPQPPARPKAPPKTA